MKKTIKIITALTLAFVILFATSFLLDLQIIKINIIRKILVYILIILELLISILIVQEISRSP